MVILSRRHRAAVMAVAIAVGLWALPAVAGSPQPRAGGGRHLTMVRTDQAPAIDGRLDEPAWDQAAVADGFLQVFPVENAEPTEETVVRVMYDSEYLYVGARLYDREPEKIVASQLIQGNAFPADDRFGVTLDTFHDRRNGYFFQLNGNGMRQEALWENNQRFIEDWQTIWYGDAVVDGEGWTAEMAIPFKSLSFDPGNTTWGINFERVISRKQETDLWSSHGQKELYNVPAFAGEARGIAGLKQGLGLDVVPTLAAGYSRDFAGERTSEDSLEPSIDVFYKPSPRLTAVVTANTDFSATEVDDRQVNVTRFSLFFPEKRDFFLQDSGIFEFGGLKANGKPFFSRRIGLSAEGEPVDLVAGGKLTGRIGRASVGVLDIVQEGAGGSGSQNLAVGRATFNILQESTLGAIFTRGNPDSELDNYLAGADFHYRNGKVFGDKVMEGDLWFQKTRTEGIEGGEEAFGGAFYYPNDRYNASLTFAEIGRNFNPALGFVNRNNVRQLEAQLIHRIRPAESIFRKIEPSVWLRADSDLGNGEKSSELYLWLTFEDHDGDSFIVQYRTSRQVIENEFKLFDRLAVAPGDYTFGEYFFFFDTSAHRRFAVGGNAVHGDFYDGKRTRLRLKVQWRPSKHFFLNSDYVQNDLDLSGGRFISRLWTLRANVAFNAEWSWSNLVQFDNVGDGVGVNSRLRFIPEPGREIFLVLNHDFEVDAENRLHSAYSGITLRGSYTFRF